MSERQTPENGAPYGHASACKCGDCYHPVIGPDTDGDPCDWCRDCGCPSADHTRMTSVIPPGVPTSPTAATQGGATVSEVVLRVPLNRAANPDGANLNRGTDHIDVPIVIDPRLDRRGETRREHGYSTTETSIVLREWDEQVLLHELLHVLLDGYVPTSVTDPHGHAAIGRVEVGLWETGWRRVATEGDGGEGRG